MLVAASGTASACGGAEDACKVELGSYFALTPDGPGPHPAVILGWIYESFTL